MTKHTKKAEPMKLTSAARALLATVADQPWGRGAFGELRILNPRHDTVCPLCMIANRSMHAWHHTLDGIEAMREMEWPITRDETQRIMNAVDKPRHPLRREVEQALGGVRVDDGCGEPEVES